MTTLALLVCMVQPSFVTANTGRSHILQDKSRISQWMVHLQLGAFGVVLVEANHEFLQEPLTHGNAMHGVACCHTEPHWLG